MTISVCMIVKNEEHVLARCLDSLKGLYEELIIVDTGSTDSTKKIASGYTDRIYDFTWINDFSAARNFAFSLATCDYIYSADADEVLDEENRRIFKQIKDNLLPEIEIVQMKYRNQLSCGTVYNFDEEYRPKLFKRLRTFTWIEPVHETVRLDPVVFDSDIAIDHRPENNHSGRDFKVFESRLAKGEKLSDRLLEMYARELFLSGSDNDFITASSYLNAVENTDISPDMHKLVCLVLARASRIKGDATGFLKYSSKIIAGESCSEICFEMGLYFEKAGDDAEAAMWFYNAAYETAPVLSLEAGNTLPLEHLAQLYEKAGNDEMKKFYIDELMRRKQTNELGR